MDSWRVVLLVALAMTALVAPAGAKPNAGNWFSEPVDADDDSNLSSIQFKVAGDRKRIKSMTIFWRCGDRSGYHNFRNLPFPIAIKDGKFKLVGATTPPAGQSTKDFTLRGEFLSRKKAKYSMKLESCGPKTRGKLKFADG